MVVLLCVVAVFGIAGAPELVRHGIRPRVVRPAGLDVPVSSRAALTFYASKKRIKVRGVEAADLPTKRRSDKMRGERGSRKAHQRHHQQGHEPQLGNLAIEARRASARGQRRDRVRRKCVRRNRKVVAKDAATGLGVDGGLHRRVNGVKDDRCTSKHLRDTHKR